MNGCCAYSPPPHSLYLTKYNYACIRVLEIGLWRPLAAYGEKVRRHPIDVWQSFT
jgi:hypothetical protein